MTPEQLNQLDCLLSVGARWPSVRRALLGRWAWLWHPWRTLRLRRLTADLQAARERASARVKARGSASEGRLSRAQREYAVAQVAAGATDEAILDALELTGPLRDVAQRGITYARKVHERIQAETQRRSDQEVAQAASPFAHIDLSLLAKVPGGLSPEADASDRA